MSSRPRLADRGGVGSRLDRIKRSEHPIGSDEASLEVMPFQTMGALSCSSSVQSEPL